MGDLLRTHYPQARSEIMGLVTEKGGWEGETTHTAKDGRKMNILSRWALQKDGSGRPLGIMQINHDITQRLKLEEQLRQAEKVQAIGTLAGVAGPPTHAAKAEKTRLPFPGFTSPTLGLP